VIRPITFVDLNGPHPPQHLIPVVFYGPIFLVPARFVGTGPAVFTMEPPTAVIDLPVPVNAKVSPQQYVIVRKAE
jgi:hypothetical protein